MFSFFFGVEIQLTRTNCSDYTGAQTKLPKILLNGNNICMVDIPLSPFRYVYIDTAQLTRRNQLIPGGEGPVATAPTSS